MGLQDRIESAITEATGKTAQWLKESFASGGSINISRIVKLKDGRHFFVKTHSNANNYPGIFEAEFEALKLLAEPKVIRVPEPISFDKDFIVMEAYKESQRKTNWHELIGRQLAQLHLATKTDQFGFDHDNYIGTTQQENDWMDNWLEFWREKRLAWQLRLYAHKTSADDPLLSLGNSLLDNLDDLIGKIDEPAVLLHGDLWSGNAAADEKGDPIIYDPASYYGNREAEIGMMRLFGGFGPRCEAAYEEVWPFQDGAEDRITLYRLYHELNHLNLFGSSYYQSCLSTIRHLLQIHN